MATREPGQVRKEAALSGLRHALRECLSGAGGGVSASEPASTEGARSTFGPPPLWAAAPAYSTSWRPSSAGTVIKMIFRSSQSDQFSM
jgi:hypothetical protein